MEENEKSWESIPQVWRIIWIIIIVCGLVFLASLTLKNNTNKYAIIQTVVLTLTLIVVAWYTVETHRMQIALIRQTNLSVLPLFIAHVCETIVYVRDSSGREIPVDQVELENIGNGVALNVQVDPICVDFETPMLRTSYSTPHIAFENIVIIPPNTKIHLPHVSWGDETRELEIHARLDLVRKLSPRWAEKDYEMKIRFRDMLGNKYVQIIHVGKNGCWPDIVVSDENAIVPTSYLPVKPPNPFTSSPMRYLRMRRPTLTKR